MVAGLKVGDMTVYTGEPTMVTTVVRSGPDWWVPVGWGNIPVGVPCVIIDLSKYPGMWIVMTGEGIFHVSEKFLRRV